MAEVPRLTIGSSAEQVECRDELITQILSRVSTSDVLKMSIVCKRWHSLIFDPDFAHTHYKTCHRESILFIVGLRSLARDTRTMPQRYKFRSYNSETGSLSIYPFLCEGLDSSVENGNFKLFTASNGLMCFYPRFDWNCFLLRDIPVLWVYNPVRKFSKKLSMPFQVDLHCIDFAEICYIQNTLKIVMTGYSFSENRRYTLVFDSHSNSWHEGPPLFIDLAEEYHPRPQLFFNGVIYFVASIYEKESTEIKDVEILYRDDHGLLHMIIGYDVNQDQWGFSVFVPASVGHIYFLTEWEGNLLVCASNSSHRYDRYDWRSDGHFVFWILDTEHKLWIPERELDLSHYFHTSWIVSARRGVVWFTCGHNSDSVIVYYMKTRRCSTHRLNDVFTLGREVFTSFVIFEPTLLSF